MSAAIVYEGPSALGPDPIVVLVTASSTNIKTGDMCQSYILLRDIAPIEASRSGADVSICGACRHRGDDGGKGRSCYVGLLTGGPHAVWKAYQAGKCEARRPADVLAGQHVRIGSYGDPAALPAAFWRRALAGAAGWTGYTHQWATCDQRFRDLCMASVDTPDEFRQAQALGWRTFRARPIGGDLLAGEFQCPAADESGHRTTCRKCRLCRGLASPAKSVTLELHGARFKSPHGEQFLAARDSLGLLRTHLEAGDPVELPSTARDASRVRFALSMYYRRRNDVRRISVRAVRPGIFEFSIRASIRP